VRCLGSRRRDANIVSVETQIGPHATPRPPHDNLSFEEKTTARDYWLVILIRFNVVSNSAIQVVDF
jgi:hypothetical protein